MLIRIFAGIFVLFAVGLIGNDFWRHPPESLGQSWRRWLLPGTAALAAVTMWLVVFDLSRPLTWPRFLAAPWSAAWFIWLLAWLEFKFRRVNPVIPEKSQPPSPPRRRFLKKAAVAALAGAGAYGYAVARRAPEWVTYNVAIPGWPPKLPAFTLVQLSDLHASIFSPPGELASIVKLINDQKPDLLAVTGDFVDFNVDYAAPVANQLRLLHARYGVYAVLGNHDFYAGAAPIAKALQRAGIIVLRNQHTLIADPENDARLQILGLDDAYFNFSRDRTLPGLRTGCPRLLLAHQPFDVPWGVAHGCDLILCGHTHGGQIAFPGELGRTLSPARLVTRYVAGYYREGATQIIVNTGLGSVGLPLRLGVPPQLVRIVINPA